MAKLSTHVKLYVPNYLPGNIRIIELFSKTGQHNEIL